MPDEREHTSEPGADPKNNVDNKLNSLLPKPGESAGEHHEPAQVDNEMDEVLPAPGKSDTSTDDASTREELEVDSTADGIDDFISLRSPQTDETKETLTAEDTPRPSTCLFCGRDTGGTRFCPACGTEQVPTSRVVARLAPIFMWSRPLAIRVTLAIGALLVLLALLSDNGAIALIIASATLPVVILIRLVDQLGGLDRSGWVQIAMMILVGIAVGLPIAWLATRMVRRSWVEGGVVNWGATSFGGIAVETAGMAPILIWLTCGILLPLVVVLAIAAIPAALRMALTMPPRESSGMLLSAGVAAGFTTGSAAVFYWPLFTEMPPVMSTSQWTLTIMGVAVIRPIIWTFSGAIIGSVVWRYLRSASFPGVAMPAAIAIGLVLLFSLVQVAAAPAGLWAAFVTGLIVAGAAVYLHSRFLTMAIHNDRNSESTPTP